LSMAIIFLELLHIDGSVNFDHATRTGIDTEIQDLHPET